MVAEDHSRLAALYVDTAINVGHHPARINRCPLNVLGQPGAEDEGRRGSQEDRTGHPPSIRFPGAVLDDDLYLRADLSIRRPTLDVATDGVR